MLSVDHINLIQVIQNKSSHKDSNRSENMGIFNISHETNP